MSESKHTPGPWKWFGHAQYGVYLATVKGGRQIVMDFVRKGMGGAQPRFQPPGGVMVKADDLLQFEVGRKDIVGLGNVDESVYRLDVRGIDNADARLIAAAPDLLEACKAAMSVMSGGCTDDVERGAPSGAAMNLLASAIRKAEEG